MLLASGIDGEYRVSYHVDANRTSPTVRLTRRRPSRSPRCSPVLRNRWRVPLWSWRRHRRDRTRDPARDRPSPERTRLPSRSWWIVSPSETRPNPRPMRSRRRTRRRPSRRRRRTPRGRTNPFAAGTRTTVAAGEKVRLRGVPPSSRRLLGCLGVVRVEPSLRFLRLRARTGAAELPSSLSAMDLSAPLSQPFA